MKWMFVFVLLLAGCSCDEYCSFQKAVASGSFEECRGLPEKMEYSCIATIGGEAGERSACVELEGQDYEFCVMGVAIANEDLDVCDLSTDRIGCATGVAIVHDNEALCEGLIGEYREGCFMGLAVVHKNIEECDRIVNLDYVALCQSRVSKDLSYCDGIGEERLKSYCLN